MQHYFIETTHKATDYFDFDAIVAGTKYTFHSCDNIFSKDEVDLGSKTLIETCLNQLSLNGYGLDFGCGYGVISVVLMKNLNVKMDLADVNSTALELSKTNLERNNIQGNYTLIKSDNFDNIKKDDYDFIVTNPPIKTGKKLLFSIMENCFSHLKVGGTLTLVIRKDHGEDSLRKHLISIFGNCEIIKRNKGHYILHCVKN